MIRLWEGRNEDFTFYSRQLIDRLCTKARDDVSPKKTTVLGGDNDDDSFNYRSRFSFVCFVDIVTMKSIRPLNDKVQAPFMPVSQGHGYLGTLLYDENEDKIQCHECGDWFERLAPHLQSDHLLKARDYKEKYELNYTTALQIPSVSRKQSIRSEFMHRLNFETVGKEEIKQKMRDMQRKGVLSRKRRNFRFTVEMMNKYGSCPKQIEERFVNIIEKLGHTPSFDELRKEDHSLLSVLYRRFKSYRNALAYFGLKGKRRFSHKEYGRKNIKLALEKFVDEERRLPNPQDTKTGFLPDYETVRKYFGGSWIKARAYAYKILKERYPKEASIYYFHPKFKTYYRQNINIFAGV